jgi:putative ABC transport system permease protein
VQSPTLFIEKLGKRKSEFVLQETLSMALYNLSRRKMRTGLTLLGIIVGIGAVVALISLGNGMEAAISDALQSFGPNKVYVAPNVGSGGFGPMGSGESLTEKDLEIIQNVKNVKFAIPVLVKSLPVEYDGKIRILNIMGIPPKESKEFFSDIQSIELSSGRFIGESEKYTIAAGSLIEKDTFSEDVKLKGKFIIKDTKFRVVGFLKSLGNPSDDSQLYMSIDTLREITNDPEGITAIMVEAYDNPTQVAKDIQAKLDKEHGEDTMMVMTTEQVQEQIQSIFGVMSIVLGGIASISLVVAGFGIMNTMLMSVLERTREIGIMKAIGATNRKIMMVFLIETATLGLIGGVLGIAFGSIVYLGISYAATNFLGVTLAMFISPSLMLLALLFSMFVGVASGLYPAWRASKLNPVEALRYE